MTLKNILIGLNGMAVICTDDEAAIDGAIELLKSQAALIKEIESKLSIEVSELIIECSVRDDAEAKVKELSGELKSLRKQHGELIRSTVKTAEDMAKGGIESAEKHIVELRERAEKAESHLSNFKGHLGVDKKPDEYALVEVYNQSMFSGMRPANWTGWLADSVKDWHLWRPSFAPDDSVLARSEEIRRQLGVVELEGNGLYRLPDKE